MTTSNFGRAIAVHKGTIAASGWNWYVGGILVLSAIANVVQGLILFAGISLLAGAFVLSFAVLRLKQSVEVYERGLVWKRLWRTTTIGADEVRRATLVHNYRRTGYYVEVRIAMKKGGTYSIIGVTDADGLRNCVGNWANAPSANEQAQRAAAAAAWVPPAARTP